MAVGSKLNVDGAGRDLVAGDVALHANWGTNPVLALSSGANRAAGVLTVTAKATTGANPTIVITYPEAYDKVPAIVVSRGDAVSNTAGEIHAVSTATAATITFDGTPTADQVYVINYVVVEP